jgi:myo-inositol-1(or 4)-monophosphatase
MNRTKLLTGEFGRFARRLALAAGEKILGHYQKELVISRKADRSIVTQADREAETLMREMIRREYPGHGILGEEFGRENEGAELVWVLDPLDGTISFAHGSPLFATLIALLVEGQPVLGVIHNPVLHELCMGDGQDVMLNDAPVRTRDVRSLSDATLLATDLRGIQDRWGRQRLDQLIASVAVFRTWGDAYGYLMLAAGRADIMLDSKMAPWDILPLVPILRGAGGVITSWTGGDPVTGDSCVAAGAGLHQQVIDLLNP